MVSTRALTSPAARACSARARNSSSAMKRVASPSRLSGSGMAGPPTSLSLSSMYATSSRTYSGAASLRIVYF